MQQLNLFGELAEASGSQPGEPVCSVPVSETAADFGQLGLFSDRWLSATGAHAALERFELQEATSALHSLLQRYPGDRSLMERAAAIERLSGALAQARALGASTASALARVSRAVPAFIEPFWRRRLALAIEAEAGPGGVVEGVPAGFHWLALGQLSEAENSLRNTLERDPRDARARAYLADVLTLQGRQAPARAQYRDAFAQRPSLVDLERLRDAAVQRLPALAECEFEVPGDGVEWVAAIGVMTGTFLAPDWAALRATSSADARSTGVEFYHWLGRELLADSMPDRLACRRAMRALASQVFAQYMALKR